MALERQDLLPRPGEEDDPKPGEKLPVLKEGSTSIGGVSNHPWYIVEMKDAIVNRIEKDGHSAIFDGLKNIYWKAVGPEYQEATMHFAEALAKQTLLDQTFNAASSSPYYSRFKELLGQLDANASGDNEPTYLTTATEAVRDAEEQLRRAQEQLKQAQEIKQAMLELAQLSDARKAHRELYGSDKEGGLSAAQEYLAFKETQREQQPPQQ